MSRELNDRDKYYPNCLTFAGVSGTFHLGGGVAVIFFPKIF